MKRKITVWLVGLIGLVAVAGTGFVIAREFSSGLSAKAIPLTAATPAPGQQVCGKDLAPDKSVIRSYCIQGTPPPEFWYVPLQKADEAKPRFDGTVNGIRLGPNVESGDEGGPCAGVNPSSPNTGPISEAETVGSPLEIYLPFNTITDQSLFHAGTCTGVISSVEKGFTIFADPATGRFGGPLSIYRFRGDPAFIIDAPADRVNPGSIGGRSAVLVRPLTDSGFGESAVYVKESFGLTVLRASGIPLGELVRIAESLY
jgi:hypothetical protein